MAKINTDALANVTLARGRITNSKTDLCLMQAISLVTGQIRESELGVLDIEDEPSCVDRELIFAGQRLNDQATPGQRQQLKSLIPRLIGTRDDGQKEARYAAWQAMLPEIESFWLAKFDPKNAAWFSHVRVPMFRHVITWACHSDFMSNERPGWDLAYSIFDRVLRAGETLVNEATFGSCPVVVEARDLVTV